MGARRDPGALRGPPAPGPPPRSPAARPGAASRGGRLRPGARRCRTAASAAGLGSRPVPSHPTRADPIPSLPISPGGRQVPGLQPAPPPEGCRYLRGRSGAGSGWEQGCGEGTLPVPWGGEGSSRDAGSWGEARGCHLAAGIHTRPVETSQSRGSQALGAGRRRRVKLDGRSAVVALGGTGLVFKEMGICTVPELIQAGLSQRCLARWSLKSRAGV